MRKSLLMVGIPVSVLGLGLATFVALRSTNTKPADSFAKELEAAGAAGLQLAQSQAANQFALSETVPEAKPEPKTAIKRGNGVKAIRSTTPTVKAAPEPVAADVVEEVPDLSRVMESAGPSATVAVVPSAPAPSPDVTPAPAQDNGPILRGGNGAGSGSGGGGIGIGTVMGGVFGAVIRGGVVDGDNCDLHRSPRSGARGPVNTAVNYPVYGRNPGMGAIRGGGWGGRTGQIAAAPARPRGR
jgi:hypothetical protein